MNILESRKAKIKWQCRRGMLELDLLLERFVAQQLDNLSEDQLEQFTVLLTHSDPEIYSYLMNEQLPNKELTEIVALVKLHSNVR